MKTACRYTGSAYSLSSRWLSPSSSKDRYDLPVAEVLAHLRKREV
ncbi:hypothetical protein SAMN05421505_101149 [Sinosporangium album]|uniref:Uncharacterized protein n=1 Tax=Sinosporangium album TaxID=504805 RepID=A0A1G7QYN6_9ACTN|nr:hypothetical protein SAMN05421505_101149 [Sinosporangium album]